METLQKENQILRERINMLEKKPKRTTALKNAQLKYYEKNKEVITARNILYNKDYGKREFICECGSIMPHHSKYKHLKSKKHCQYIENNTKCTA